MIQYKPVSTPEELQGILRLQKANLPLHLTESEIREQGFVTVSHTLAQLQKLHDIEPGIIAKSGDEVIGYILAMTQASRHDIQVLIPMFDLFDTLVYQGRPVNDYHYMLIGQVCVDKSFRGQSVFDRMYETYIDHFRGRYDFAITEIAQSNLRSLNAHRRAGFKTIHTYHSPDGVEWAIVILDWTR